LRTIVRLTTGEPRLAETQTTDNLLGIVRSRAAVVGSGDD
jgi:hypothetical protein